MHYITRRVVVRIEVYDMTEVDQKLRDKFKTSLCATVYRRASSDLVAQLFQWDRTRKVYTNTTIQSFFVLFMEGVAYGQDTASQT